MNIAMLVFLGVIGAIAVPAAIGFVVLKKLGKKASAAGYPSRRAWLRAVPRNDAEKAQAVDLTLKGSVLCVLGLFFPPLILVGVIPFYYGARKLLLVWLGLDILAEADHSNA